MNAVRLANEAAGGMGAAAETAVRHQRSDADSTTLRERLEPLTAAAPGATGVIAAAVRGPESALLCHGRRDLPQLPAHVGPHTRFELGSVTKTFTALLLAEMVTRGDVRLDDPITAYLPAGAAPRHPSARRITLLHLATHTSGLPRLPANLYPVALPRWGSNPYADYTPEHLLQAASRIRLHGRPGTRLHYSNFGVGLLGRLLAEAVGEDYERLVAARVCAPLGMTGTHAGTTSDDATGYRRGRPVPPWLIPGLPGAGCLRSSASDLLHYLDALVHPDATPLGAPLHDVCRARLVAPHGGDRLCLVWNLRSFPGHELVFHSGGTRGFTTFAGFSRQAGVGLAAATNTAPTLRGTFIRTAYQMLKSLISDPVAKPDG
ncbi:serine hydrolase domain-containing protein [Streptomyces sp. KR80]|uniref:serine hydrolase domain-containing protein n=1 Tax=Streptomyces sp. KR80 TaxID=3457426 RepID=UPI003FCFD5E8